MYTMNRDSILTVAMLIMAMIVVAILGVGCSTDHGIATPVASSVDPAEATWTDPCDIGPDYCYPPLTAEQLNDGPAPGWTFLRKSARDTDNSLDDAPTLVTRLIQQNQTGILTASQNQITIPQGAIPYSQLLVSMAVPGSAIAMVEFGPHGTQFNCPVTIRLNFSDYELPEGMSGQDLAIWYINDDGVLELYNGTVTNNGQWLETTTNHFSRYIIAANLAF